jgi:hypothetical protein
MCDVIGYGCPRLVRWWRLRCNTCRRGCWGIVSRTEIGTFVFGSHLPHDILDRRAS